jgi:3-hydroxyacyl-CoA dehydrogenase/enoyl-CoA hydratase/3-hydroxybutyryl-CoA epimerase
METKNIKLTINDGIATLCFDMENEKVNKLSQEVLKELQIILEELKQDKTIKVLLLTSAKENIFIAGADINEIKQMNDEDDIYNILVSIDAILNELENLPYPTVAVINGACMGGGLELALCCKYRIATNAPKTKIAFPEIKLGIFPGFGGTQRAPKLIGLINALDLILTGKTIDAKKAYRIGLVDKYFMEGHLEFKVKEFVDSILNNTLKARKKSFKFMEYFNFTREIIFSKAKENLIKKVHPNFKGPYAALELIHNSYGNSLKEGIEKEAKAFASLAITAESKNLIDLFFISEEIKKDYKNTKFDKEIQKTAVIGNGVMGKGIIWLFSKYTNDVRIKLRKLEQVESILAATNKLYAFFLKTRKMTKKQVEFKLNHLSYTDKFNGLSLTDFAIEAIVENSEQKMATYKELELHLDKNAIIATNTSSISINCLSQELQHKERFLGVHFFNPVNKMPLVEVIPSKYTSQDSIAKSFEFLRRCGKMPILVGDCAGFLVNRVLIPYINEAGFILEDGNSIVTIDDTLKEFGMPMGAFILADEVGIDVGLKVADILYDSYGERMKVSSVLRMVHDDLKLLGKKAGKGFYIHNKNADIVVNLEITKNLKNNTNVATTKEITNRAIFIMINEASRCLEEGIIKKVTHLDFAMIAGTGFPAFRGGLLKYADDMGIDYIVDKLETYTKLFGERFTPSDLLYKLKESKKTFYTGEELWNH